jgi:hypothetical protein
LDVAAELYPWQGKLHVVLIAQIDLGPFPSYGDGRRTLDPCRTSGETSVSPGHVGTGHLDRVKLTVWSNVICERTTGTLHREILVRLLIINQHHLRQVLTERASFVLGFCRVCGGLTM